MRGSRTTAVEATYKMFKAAFKHQERTARKSPAHNMDIDLFKRFIFKDQRIIIIPWYHRKRHYPVVDWYRNRKSMKHLQQFSHAKVAYLYACFYILLVLLCLLMDFSAEARTLMDSLHDPPWTRPQPLFGHMLKWLLQRHTQPSCQGQPCGMIRAYNCEDHVETSPGNALWEDLHSIPCLVTAKCIQLESSYCIWSGGGHLRVSLARVFQHPNVRNNLQKGQRP